MNKKFAIFDFDGCLVDSMKFRKSLSKDYLESIGIKTNIEELNKKIAPMTLMESSKYFKEKFKIEDSTENIYKAMIKIIENHYIFDVALKEDVDFYLSKLKKNSVRMCIASSSEKYLIKKAIQRLNIEKYFEFIITCDEVGFGKDRPEIYLKCAEKFKVKNEEIAVYEDSLFAIRTANKVGFYTVGIKDIWQEKYFADIEKESKEIIEKFKDEI